MGLAFPDQRFGLRKPESFVLGLWFTMDREAFSEVVQDKLEIAAEPRRPREARAPCSQATVRNWWGKPSKNTWKAWASLTFLPAHPSPRPTRR